MKYSTETFIKKAREIHGDKYDYSKTDLENKDEKGRIIIICPEHGEFFTRPNTHLSGRECLYCSGYNKKTTEDFVKEAKQVHGDKYDYSKTEYVNSQTKVCIICPEHGEFWQFPNGHINGHGCPKCGRIKRDKSCTKDIQYVKQKCNEIFGDRYNIVSNNYTGIYCEIDVLCKEHGIFKTTPNRLMNGHGCPTCGGNQKLTTEEFIKRAKEVHGDKYDYSKVDFKGTDKKVCIICPKHGEFWQFANGHLIGRGCPHCKQSSLEKEVRDFLEKENIQFIAQKRSKWLGKQSLDFYLPEYNIAIECQGQQHFKPSEYFGGNERYLKTKELDLNKNKICKEHNIEILYYTHCEEKYEFELIKDLETLKNKIYAKNGYISKNQYLV